MDDKTKTIDKGLFKGAKLSVKVLDFTILLGFILLTGIFIYCFIK